MNDNPRWQILQGDALQLLPSHKHPLLMHTMNIYLSLYYLPHAN